MAPRTRVRRPVAVLVAVLVGLGAVGTTAGAALGTVGGGPGMVHHHGVDGPRFPQADR